MQQIINKIQFSFNLFSISIDVEDRLLIIHLGSIFNSKRQMIGSLLYIKKDWDTKEFNLWVGYAELLILLVDKITKRWRKVQ
jgi:hypothetical protein